MFKIKWLYLAIGLLSSPLALAEGSEYINAYGKAYREWTRRVDEAERRGKPLTRNQLTTLHGELFSDARKAYVKETNATYMKMYDLGRQVAIDLRSGLTGTKDKASKKDGKKQKLTEEKFEPGKAATPDATAVPVRAIASGAKDGAAKTAAPSGDARTGGEAAKPGSADDVSFTKAAPGKTQTPSLTTGAAADEAGAQDVSFTNGTGGTNGAKGGTDGGQVKFGAPTAPGKAPPSKK